MNHKTPEQLAFSPAQCRAARALLSWTQDELAKHANVGIVTVRQYELGVRSPREATLARMKAAFETAGVVLDRWSGRALQGR